MEIRIQNKTISNTSPVLIVAELSANHNQSFKIAVKTLRAMKESGADAVKLQTYTADTMTIDCDNDYFKIKNKSIWDGKTFYELYKEAYTPWEWQPKLKEIAEKLDLIFFSTPFDKTSVDFLEEIGVPCYKIASFEITDIPLISYVASKGKPIIISNGIATLDDLKEAIEACKEQGNSNIILLKCTSAYPAPYEEINLKTIEDMAKRFGCHIGLSDHSMGISTPIAATALGAKIIEKHFILDRSIGGPDSSFSMEPLEFKLMAQSIREVEKALGRASYELTNNAKKNRVYARSLFVVKDIKKGENFTNKNIRSIRPGYGMHPRDLKYVLGEKAKINIKKGLPLKKEFVENEE